MMAPIEFDEFLRRIDMNPENFIVAPQLIEQVVSLKTMSKVEQVIAMPNQYLENLLKNIGLADDPYHKIYRYATIKRLRVDPHDLLIGQCFVYRYKYVALLEQFKELFSGFTLPRGFSKLTPQIIYGRDKNDKVVLAHYVPPIIEVHDNERVLLDGIHRDFLIMNAGTTIESIIVVNPGAPFPAQPKSWNHIKVTDEKPQAVEDRYFDLQPNLFRNLTYVGIDG